MTNAHKGSGYAAVQNAFLCLLQRKGVESFCRTSVSRILFWKRLLWNTGYFLEWRWVKMDLRLVQQRTSLGSQWEGQGQSGARESAQGMQGRGTSPSPEPVQRGHPTEEQGVKGDPTEGEGGKWDPTEAFGQHQNVSGQRADWVRHHDLPCFAQVPARRLIGAPNCAALHPEAHLTPLHVEVQAALLAFSVSLFSGCQPLGRHFAPRKWRDYESKSWLDVYSVPLRS